MISTEENEKKIEKQIIEKGLTNPRVTIEQINKVMKLVEYESVFVNDGKSCLAIAKIDNQILESCILQEHYDALSKVEDLARNFLWKAEGYSLKMQDLIKFGNSEDDANHLESLMSDIEYKCMRVFDTTTIHCVAFLHGFSLGIGVSACVDPNNFNQEIGENIAISNAENLAYETLHKLEMYRFLKNKKEKETENE